MFDGRVPDGAVHPLDLPVGPWMVRPGEAILDTVGLADHVKAHLTRGCSGPVAGLVGEPDAVVGEDGADTIGHGSASRTKLVAQTLMRSSLGPRLGNYDLFDGDCHRVAEPATYPRLHRSTYPLPPDRSRPASSPLALVVGDDFNRRTNVSCTAVAIISPRSVKNIPRVRARDPA